MNNIQSPRGLEYLHAETDSIDRNLASPREVEEVERGFLIKASPIHKGDKQEPSQRKKHCKNRSHNADKFPFDENSNILNHPIHPPHTDESFGESNLYNPFTTQSIHLDHSEKYRNSPDFDDEMMTSTDHYQKDRSYSDSKRKGKISNSNEGIRPSPKKIKENNQEPNLQRSLSMDKKKSKPLLEKNKDKNHQNNLNPFENIMSSFQLLKNSIDQSSDHKGGSSKDKNYKKYNEFFKRQKELVEQSEK
jgi:hypothetical protein